ncbi:FAD-dependent oxidoreductase [Niveispirillum sp. KHB5.9]|uniref:FAD-dependent oxidoreductase n=1 Tax=Niveispirillum sp. KHB5.9 TaxID=3400269 RepID=UPI003A83A448
MTRPALARRSLLTGGGAALSLAFLGGCATGPGKVQVAAPKGPVLTVPPLRASIDRITQITVCTRPFRPQGPRIERMKLGDKDLVHHYGHGGSGWSLSWGSAMIATDLAMGTGAKDIAVIGCGAIGLTTALQLQRAGAKVTIHARELPPQTRSSLATGVWSPDSRICLEAHATPEFKAQWAGMARASFDRYQTLLGLAGTPVEWIDNHVVLAPGNGAAPAHDDRPAFAHGLTREMTPELRSPRVNYAAGSHPFGEREVLSVSGMMFNIASYSHYLLSSFLELGGRIEVREFHSPADLSALPQKTLVNCTGYGAKALFGDNSLVPVRGQLARMIPDGDIRYGLFFNQVSFVPRRDGWVFQVTGADEYYGFGIEDATPDRAEAERAVTTIAGLFAGV